MRTVLLVNPLFDGSTLMATGKSVERTASIFREELERRNFINKHTRHVPSFTLMDADTQRIYNYEVQSGGDVVPKAIDNTQVNQFNKYVNKHIGRMMRNEVVGGGSKIEYYLPIYPSNRTNYSFDGVVSIVF